MIAMDGVLIAVDLSRGTLDGLAPSAIGRYLRHGIKPPDDRRYAVGIPAVGGAEPACVVERALGPLLSLDFKRDIALPMNCVMNG